MGPQHPMTHGLWNMKVKVDGETITDAKPEIGYLHRGYEKIMEVREFQKNVVLTDRLCYVSSITWSHAYCLAVEKMMGIETPERGQWIRVIALELQRVASHLMWLASYGPDLGLLTGLLWCLRERELFLDLIQLMSGARMNQNYPRVGGVRNDLPENFEAMCKRSIEHFLEKVKNEYPQIFQESKVFRMRTEGVGTISAADAINWGVTGPNLRACGVNVDLRRLDPYETYEEIDFEPQVWHDGGAGASAAPREQTRRRGLHPRVRGRVRRGDGQVSAPLVPNLFAVCKVLVAAILSIVQQLIYALSGPVPPLRGLGDFVGSDPIVSI